ncbi:MAG: C25 family cysteine peptidase, partial [Acidimicrobiia bacterium]
RFVNDADGPALLFSATHGLGFPSGDPEQRARQGALVCQEWEGPYSKCPVGREQSFAADDVADDAELGGLVSFMFACFGGGTPQFDDFAARTPGTREQLAPEDFGAALPKRLLGHPRGGALAVIAHVDRAWSYSFHWPSVGAQTAVYESALLRLLDGKPVGFALEYFNERYAELASDLSVMLEDIRYGKVADDLQLAGAWTANNDARAFAIFGDPAVRMAVAS